MFIFLNINANSSYVLNFFSERRIVSFENEACNIKLMVEKVINLENNFLKNMAAFSKLTQIQEINLSNNQIGNIRDI